MTIYLHNWTNSAVFEVVNFAIKIKRFNIKFL